MEANFLREVQDKRRVPLRKEEKTVWPDKSNSSCVRDILAHVTSSMNLNTCKN